MAITELEARAECRIGHVGPVLVTCWYSVVTVAALDAVQVHFLELAKRYEHITVVTLGVNLTRAPQPDVRERVKVLHPTIARHRIGNIVVILATGLGGILARSFVAVLSLFTQENMLVVASGEEAAKVARGLAQQVDEVKRNATLGADLAAYAKLPAPTLSQRPTG